MCNLGEESGRMPNTVLDGLCVQRFRWLPLDSILHHLRCVDAYITLDVWTQTLWLQRCLFTIPCQPDCLEFSFRMLRLVMLPVLKGNAICVACMLPPAHVQATPSPTRVNSHACVLCLLLTHRQHPEQRVRGGRRGGEPGGLQMQ